MFFNKFLDQLLNFNSYNRKEWIKEQARQVPAGHRVLDAGAGTGPYRQFFSHCDYKTHDFGQAANIGGEYTSLDYISDITSIPVSDQSFDMILCTEVLEHVPEPIKALQEFARILRPGGRLLLTAPLGCRLHQEPYHYYGGFTPYWYRTFLPKNGFLIHSIERNQGFFSHFSQEARYFSTLISPFRERKLSIVQRTLLAILWALTLLLFKILLPILGASLDKIGICDDDTVGYHISAGKMQGSYNL